MQGAMSQQTSKSCERDWRKIAEKAAKETDPEKLARVIEELCGALDKRNPQNQLRTDTPDRKPA